MPRSCFSGIKISGAQRIGKAVDAEIRTVQLTLKGRVIGDPVVRKGYVYE